MDKTEFQDLAQGEVQALFQQARDRDELSFLFAILGIDSGEEAPGWQTREETRAIMGDLIRLINAPLHEHTRIRLALLLYCHITEANFIYHCIYNMLLTVSGKQPNVFTFVNKYKSDVPPSVGVKLKEIRTAAKAAGRDNIPIIFDEIFKPAIRNAFFHSDYILFGEELRLKHRGSEYEKIPINDMLSLLENTLSFVNAVSHNIQEGRKSFPVGYTIVDRKNAHGGNLASANVVVDEESGLATGFSISDPLPLW